ncbi:hypothetical protein RJ639_020358 [Escallonia herrerae]|uniref:Glycosyltransferase n=1 Tax=Escallonia herrerae TaxID=1293975 RepID=A0AA89AGQ2_9ASTE|nr:hypothetical protein RJ639_020358 [Escallonia herrerae]
MSTPMACNQPQPHVALLPSAGMGHLTPFLRLAAMLASRSCTVTLITIQPTISEAESTHITSFFATHPHINRLDFHVHPSAPSDTTTDDPFFIRFGAISHSGHLLGPLLCSLSPPLSAIFSDFILTSGVSQVCEHLCIPNYTVITTSARFYSLMACLPYLSLEDHAKTGGSDNDVEIPGLGSLPPSIIPPPLFNSNHLFTNIIETNARFLPKAKGIFLNTFDGFEPETITAQNNGEVLTNLPPVLPIGPYEPYELKQGHHIPWLDDQPAESVVYVSFGSRTTMSKDQVRELGKGLKRSGHRFLWVLKASKVDKDDKEGVEELLGHSFLEETKNEGIVVKEWVQQEEILAHPAIGGFISHCGWNSVMEAAQTGVPVLAWPQHGDQKVNAEVVEKAELGIWARHWGWGGQKLVKGEEVAEKIVELMGDHILRANAKKVGQEARKATKVGGSSDKADSKTPSASPPI